MKLLGYDGYDICPLCNKDGLRCEGSDSRATARMCRYCDRIIIRKLDPLPPSRANEQEKERTKGAAGSLVQQDIRHGGELFTEYDDMIYPSLLGSAIKCSHQQLNEDGICRFCGSDQRGIG